MALIQVNFFSQTLTKQVAMNVIMPESGRSPFPVFYLLHGLSDDHTIWQRRSRIEWYVNEKPLIVVMPDGFRGFYTDNDKGQNYGRYIIEDVIGFVERTFPTINQRSGRCIGGLSMGGYGSLRLALAYPEMFVSATSHSGAIQPWKRNPLLPADEELERVFGRKPKGSAHDILALAAKIKQHGKIFPKLRIDCGVADPLLAQNRWLRAKWTEMKISHEYAEFPGAHTWNYWNAHIRDALAFHMRALISSKNKTHE